MELLVIALIAFTSAALSGLLGLGGAVILIPAYLYLPQMFGFSPLSVSYVSGMTSVQVFVSSIAGMMIHSLKGTVDKRLVLSMGTPMTITAFAGAYLSKDVPQQSVLTIFGVMALFSAVVLLIRSAAEDQRAEFQFSFTRAVVIASVVGFFGGIVGAAGAFLLAPLMMIVLKIPTRSTIGSTLGIVIFSSAAASIGKLTTGQVPAAETITSIAGAIPGMIAGSRISHKTQPAFLRAALAILIAAVGIGMIIKVD